MSLAVGVYVHPADVTQEGLQKLADLGVREVAMATAYHAGRWTSPRPGRGLVSFLEDGVVHFRPSGPFGRLQPQSSSDVPAEGASPLERFVEISNSLGMEAHAWTVLFHNSRLGRSHPELCVRNALGDVYNYALCPSQPDVQEYGLGLVRDIGAHDGLHTLELEAAGFFGYRHSSHHDKSSFAPDPYLDFLLSCCFCDACLKGMDEFGLDGVGVQGRVAQLLTRALVDGDAMAPSVFTHLSPQEDLDPDILRGLQDFRSTVVAKFLRRIRETVPARVGLTTHFVPDAMFSGSQLGVAPDLALSLVDGVLLTHYGQNPASIRKQWDTWRFPDKERGPKSRVCIWPKAPQFKLDEDLSDLREALAERAIGGVRLYHASLLPEKTVERVCKSLMS